MAEALKIEGNKLVSAKQYELAIAKYTEAIEADGGKNYQIYTNRAIARSKLSQWEKVIQDCKASLAINTRNNVKGYYYLSIARLEMSPRQSQEALSNALQAYEICVSLTDKSITAVLTQILKCKKAVWEDKTQPETEAKGRLLENITSLMQQNLNSELSKLPQGELGTSEAQIARESLQREHDTQLSLLKESLFKRPKVPDWLIDDISFQCMHDPVMTKNGKSYERASILDHLRVTPTDPVTRSPLSTNDLTRNLELAQACDDFLKENGWAVDY